jgi:hypothetical protein
MERHARTFAATRREVLDRLLDVRGSIDHTPGRGACFVDGDAARYRRFALRWVAFRHRAHGASLGLDTAHLDVAPAVRELFGTRVLAKPR